MTPNKNLKIALASAIAAAGVSQTLQANDAVGRGAEVSTLAANCNIGTFPQTSKAGHYNQLCNVMQDSEKCLALVKRAFQEVSEGTIVVEPLHDERLQYCLQVLTKELTPNQID